MFCKPTYCSRSCRRRRDLLRNALRVGGRTDQDRTGHHTVRTVRPVWRGNHSRPTTIAIDEINAKGGLLGGRKLELVRRDDEGNPTKGVTAARELIYKEKVAVIFGGLDTPV